MPLTPLLAFISAAIAGALAAAAAFRARRSLPPWVFAVGMTLLAAEGAFAGLGASATDPREAASWQQWRLLAFTAIPSVWLLFSATYARGHRWQISSRAGVPVVVTALMPFAAVFGSSHILATAATEADTSHVYRLGMLGMVLYAAALVAAVLTVMNVERTFRAAVGTVRWRIKFMLLGVGTLFVARVYTTSQALVFRGFDTAFDSINAAALIVAAALMLRSLARAGHFDLDVYPSQSVLRSSLTILLTGVYLLVVGGLAKVVTRFGGDHAFAAKAFLVLVALVALAVVCQSDHARLRLRKFVSRNFHRPLYDYRLVWQKFAEATTSRLARPELARVIATLVADVVQALSVSVWLVNERRDGLTLAASTVVRTPARGDASDHVPDAAGIIAALTARPAAFDLELTRDRWADALQACHPRAFENGGHRACVPLISRGELLGVILLGDRVGGDAFSLQDLEMLQSLGNQAAASLMNVQLSEHLLQSRELEAFQAMATFFVHDLKNAASTLGLMLQNLPVHFDNPEFRVDALRGIAATVTHINRLISRLTALRHKLTTELVDADLNDVVNEVLAQINGGAGTTVVKEITPVPRVPLDREQFQKVVTNLVLNATEAVSPAGRVRISTAQEGGWVVLTVNDDGCGMTAAFMNEALFRPFQTTKKSGLGIGMFQSKMIVEAHGGRISVASTPGQGTTFRVFLPASAAPPESPTARESEPQFRFRPHASPAS